MLVTALEPGHRLRLVKTGRFLHGWAEIRVAADPVAPDRLARELDRGDLAARAAPPHQARR